MYCQVHGPERTTGVRGDFHDLPQQMQTADHCWRRQCHKSSKELCSYGDHTWHKRTKCFVYVDHASSLTLPRQKSFPVASEWNCSDNKYIRGCVLLWRVREQCCDSRVPQLCRMSLPILLGRHPLKERLPCASASSVRWIHELSWALVLRFSLSAHKLWLWFAWRAETLQVTLERAGGVSLWGVLRGSLQAVPLEWRSQRSWVSVADRFSTRKTRSSSPNDWQYQPVPCWVEQGLRQLPRSSGTSLPHTEEHWGRHQVPLSQCSLSITRQGGVPACCGPERDWITLKTAQQPGWVSTCNGTSSIVHHFQYCTRK